MHFLWELATPSINIPVIWTARFASILQFPQACGNSNASFCRRRFNRLYLQSLCLDKYYCICRNHCLPLHKTNSAFLNNKNKQVLKKQSPPFNTQGSILFPKFLSFRQAGMCWSLRVNNGGWWSFLVTH